MPKISVIIPVYNAEKYLRVCLDSVVNQTLEDIEIICVNDGSTDKSSNILKEYAEKDGRIIILTQKNQGAAIARNKGISVAKGEYLSLLDCDDFFELDMLEKLYKKAIETYSDIVICNSYKYNNETKEISQNELAIRKEYLPNKMTFNAKEHAKYIFNYTVGCAWNKLFKTSLIKDNNIRFQEDLQTFEDACFTFPALILAKRQCILNENLLYYRYNTKTSLMELVKKNPSESLKSVDLLKNYLQKINVYELYEQSLINMALEWIFDIEIGLKNLRSKEKRKFYKNIKTKFFYDFNILKRHKDFFYKKHYFYKVRTLNSFIYNIFYKLSILKIVV